MKYLFKLKSTLRVSNQYYYGQILKDNRVVLTLRSDMPQQKVFLLNNTLLLRRSSLCLKKICESYNNGDISYTTFCYIYIKLGALKEEDNNNFLKNLTEFSWESGLFNENKNLFFKRLPT